MHVDICAWDVRGHFPVFTYLRLEQWTLTGTSSSSLAHMVDTGPTHEATPFKFRNRLKSRTDLGTTLIWTEHQAEQVLGEARTQKRGQAGSHMASLLQAWPRPGTHRDSSCFTLPTGVPPALRSQTCHLLISCQSKGRK